MDLKVLFSFYVRPIYAFSLNGKAAVMDNKHFSKAKGLKSLIKNSSFDFSDACSVSPLEK